VDQAGLQGVSPENIWLMYLIASGTSPLDASRKPTPDTAQMFINAYLSLTTTIANDIVRLEQLQIRALIPQT
jgi:hypothetical protein